MYFCLSSTVHPADNLSQVTWQFISIALLFNATKPHNIFDDLESLHWVLLYVAVRCFKFTGRFNSQVFDEFSENVDQASGQIVFGGASKNFWLTIPTMEFKCNPLERFFQGYRLFNLDHRVKSRGANYKATTELELQNDIRGLRSLFDDTLTTPETDWNDFEAEHTLTKQLKAGAEQKRIFTGLLRSVVGAASRHKHSGIEELQSNSEARSSPDKTSKGIRGKKRGRNKSESVEEGVRRSKFRAVADGEGRGRVEVARRAPGGDNNAPLDTVRNTSGRVLRPRLRTRKYV